MSNGLIRRSWLSGWFKHLSDGSFFHQNRNAFHRIYVQFYWPFGLTAADSRTIYVTDPLNKVIRSMSLDDRIRSSEIEERKWLSAS